MPRNFVAQQSIGFRNVEGPYFALAHHVFIVDEPQTWLNSESLTVHVVHCESKLQLY